MKILIVGAGAVGGYFGGRLAQAGRDVTFLVRPRRTEQLHKEGLRIVSPHGNLTLQPKLTSTAKITAPFDLILLSVKAYGLEAAMQDFAPAVGSNTIILPMLNGMRHLDVLSARFGTANVLGGVCRVSTEIDQAGNIVQLTPIQKLVYGACEGEPSTRILAMHQALGDAAFDVELSSNILRDMWEKWLMLASLGAITCLFRGTIGEVAAAPGGRELSLKILTEAAAISAASGYPPSEQSLAWATSVIATSGSSMTASMYRDMIAGGPVEADHILGDLIARGRDHSLESPLLQAAYVALCVYQSRRNPN